MRKWVQIDGNNVIKTVYTCDTAQMIDKEIDSIFDDSVIGKQYIDFNTIIDYTPTMTIEEQKQAKIKALQEKYQAEYNTYLSQYPHAEVVSFPDKKAEAIAYNLDNTAPTPIIDSIVAGYGGTITKDEYIASVLAKVQYLAQKEGAMVAKRDAIKACTTQAELDAIVV